MFDAEETISKPILNLYPQEKYRNHPKYTLQSKYDVAYCKFKINQAPIEAGIYWIFVDGNLVYIGRAQSLKNRLTTQYGNVSPRHPYNGGQLQKCRTNSKINTCLNEGKKITFKWHVCQNYIDIENELLRNTIPFPIWNIQKPTK